MDCRSDLESSNWKTDPGGVMSQQCYLAYLNLRKSEESSKPDEKCQAEIVTVRRTRRVLYRYILDNSIDESNKTERKGETLRVDPKTQDIPRIVIKGKKQLKNIFLDPNSVPGTNSDTSRIKQSRRKISEHYQLQSTLQSENECTNLQQEKDKFSNNDLLYPTVQKSERTLNIFGKESSFEMENKFSNNSDSVKLRNLKQSDVSRSKKQTRKRPKNNSMSDSHKIVRKRRKIVSGYSVTKNIKIEDESDDDPKKIKLENNAFKRELEAATEKKLLDFHLPKVELQKHESNDKINFLLKPKKSLYNYSTELVVADEAKDERMQVIQGSRKSQNINNISPKKNSTISDNLLPVLKVEEREEPSVEIIPGIEMPFNNHSLNQRIHSLTIEEQLQELFFPRECMGEIDHFVPVPHIEIEIETSEVIPMTEGVLHYSLPASKINEQKTNYSRLIGSLQTIDHEEQETNNLRVSKHYLQSNNDNQHITDDTEIAFKHPLEPSNIEKHDTVRTKINSQEILPSNQNVDLEHNCLPRPLVDLEVRSNESQEKIPAIQKSVNTHILESSNGTEILDKALRITKDILELNNDEQQLTDSLRITEHPQDFDTDEHSISRDTPEKMEHSVEPANSAQQDIITKGILRIPEHSPIVTNKEKQQMKKENLKRLKHSLELNTERQMIGKDDLMIKHSIELTDDEQQNKRDTVIILNHSLEPELINHQPMYGTVKRLKYSVTPKDDSCQIQKDSLKISEYSLEPNINEGHVKNDSLGIIKHALSSHDEKQHNTTDRFRIPGYSVDVECRNNEQLLNTGTLSVTEHSLEPKNYECHTTKQILKITEIEPDNEQRGSLRRTEYSVVPINDKQQLTKHPLQPYNDEQQGTIDNFRFSGHSLEHGTNEKQIKADTQIIPSNIYPLDPKNDECVTTKHILKIAEVEADNEQRGSLRRTEHSVVLINDEQQITKHPLEPYNDEQHRTRDNLRLSGHSLEHGNNEKQVKSDTRIITKYPLDPKNVECHTTKHILKIPELEADNEQKDRESLRRTELSVVPINDEQQITKHSLEHYNDERHRRRDNFRLSGHSLEHGTNEQQIKADTQIITESSLDPENDDGHTTKHILKIAELEVDYEHRESFRRTEYSVLPIIDDQQITKHSLEPYFDEQHRTRDNCRLSGHSLEHGNNEQQIKADTRRITECSLEPKSHECHITNEILKIVEIETDNDKLTESLRRTEHSVVSINDEQQITKHSLEPYYDEQHRTRDNFRLSGNSQEHGNNEQQIKADTRRITECSLEPKSHECHITNEILKIVEIEADNDKPTESLRRTEHYVVSINDEQQITKHSLEPYYDEQHRTRDNLRLSGHSLEHGNNEKQVKSDTRIITKYPLGPKNVECHTTKHILKIPELEADNEQKNRESLRRTELSVVPINDEQQITKHSLEHYNDERHRRRDNFRLSGHSLEHGTNEQQIKADTQIITESSLDPENDDGHTRKHILKIAELEVDNEHRESFRRTEYSVLPIIDDQQITKHSLEPYSDEQHRTRDNCRLSGHSLEHGNNEQQIKADTQRITECSLEPKSHECHKTNEILKIVEIETDNDKLTESLRRTEHSVVSINDEQQITKHSLEPYYDEQHRTRDNFRLSGNSQEHGNNEQQIKADTRRITECSLEPKSHDCHITNEILKIVEIEADNDKPTESLRRTEHYVVSINDEQQIIKHSSQLYNDEQQHRTGDNFRLSGHSLEHENNEQPIKADTRIITKHSLEPKNDECHSTYEIQKIAELEADNDEQTKSLRTIEYSVVPINDGLHIKKPLLEPYNDEQYRRRDTSRISEQSLEVEKDEHHIEREALRITEHSIEPNSDKCQITEEILRIPQQSSDYINRESMGVREQSMEPNYDEQQRTMDNFEILSPEDRNIEQHIEKNRLRSSDYSLDTDGDEQQIETDSLRTTEHFVEPCHEEQPITKHILRISNHSLHNDEMQVEKDTVEKTEHSLRSINDEWHVTRESLEISKHSIEHNDERQISRHTEHSLRPNNDEWQITEEPLKISKHSVGTDCGEGQIIKHTLRLSEHSMEPHDDEQQIRKETLNTASDAFRESKDALESCNSEDHAIDAMRYNKHSREIIQHYVQADDNEQHIITDNLRISENSVESNYAGQEVTHYTSRIAKHCLEPSSNEELVTNYANQLQNISSPEENDGIEDSFLPELHVEVEVEINDGTEIALKIDKSLDNYSAKLNSHEEEISNDTSILSKDLFPEQNIVVQDNVSPKSISEIESRKRPRPKKIRIEKSTDKELRSCSRKVRTKEQLQSNVESALRNEAEVEESEEPSRIEVIHYKPRNYLQRQYCTFCKVGYMNGIVLEKHMSRCKLNPKNVKVDPARIFYCKICNFGITDEVFFRQHEEKCQNEVICGTDNSCSNPPIQQTASKSRRRRSTIGRHKCPNCEYTSDNIGHMGVHRRIHDKIPLCVCDVCKKGFTRLDALKLHMFRHIDVAKEVLEVEKVSVWNGNASKSILEVNIKNKDFTIVKYQCSKCKYAAPLAESMEKHINSIHLNLSQFKCHLCPFTTKLKTNLKQHLNWHSKEKTYKCSYCSYETINKTYIKQHENQVHLKTVSFKCGLCDFIAYRKENLKTHVHSIHLKMKKYPCKKCDYFSYVQSNLIAHVKCIHEGIKRKYKRT